MNRNTDSETTDRTALAKERWSSLYKAGKTKWPYTDERDRFRGTDTASWKTYRKTQARPKKHIEESIVNFATFMEEFLEDIANAHEKAYADYLADKGDFKGARKIDISLRKQASVAAKAKHQAANTFFISPPLKDKDSGPSFHQDKKEIAKGIRDEKGKLTSKGKAIYARKDARLFGK